MRFQIVVASALLILSACSGGGPDQEAIDKAVAEALAERDREAAQSRGSTDADAGSEPASETISEGSTGKSTEPLREGLPDGMGSPYGMCIRTLSIVGEHCGCMVNRAMDAGIGSGALVRMFGGDGSRATPDEAARFTRIVRSCSGYNITVRNAGAALREPVAVAPAQSAAPRTAQLKGRRVACYFRNAIAEYDGPCDFVTGPGGDFETTSLNGDYFDGVTQIGLDVTATGVGQLEYTFPDGTVRSAYVERSREDRACWQGSGVVFCAR